MLSGEMANDLDYTDKYNTSLTKEEESKFQTWASTQSKSTGRDVSKDLYDYDLKGWWKDNQDATLSDKHLTDEFKKPNHPTFSTFSKYNNVDGTQGGQWNKQSDTTWSFTPGLTNLQNFSADEMKDYFAKVEPGNKVNLPGN